MRQHLCTRFRCFKPQDLSEDDVKDIENALEVELGRKFVVEPKRKLTHISPDGYYEYRRRLKLAKEFLRGEWKWPDNWYDIVIIVEEKMTFDDETELWLELAEELFRDERKWPENWYDIVLYEFFLCRWNWPAKWYDILRARMERDTDDDF